MMMARYGEEAARAGVYIMNYCGFDCVPIDLGTIEMQKNFEGQLSLVISRWLQCAFILEFSIAEAPAFE